MSKRIKRASKPDVLPEYFNLLKYEQSKKIEKSQRRMDKLKREEDRTEGAGLDYEQAQKPKVRPKT